RLLALDHLAFNSDDKLAAHLLSFGVRSRLRFLVKNHLDDPGAVAHVEKKQVAEIASPMHPAHHHGVAVFVLRAQFAAVVCPLQIPQKIQHCPNPFPNPTSLSFRAERVAVRSCKLQPVKRGISLHFSRKSSNCISLSFCCVPSASVFSVHSPLETSL